MDGLCLVKLPQTTRNVYILHFDNQIIRICYLQQERVWLLSDSGTTSTNSFPTVNWVGIALGIGIFMFCKYPHVIKYKSMFMKNILVIQMAMPGLRQVGDFVAAIYGPYGGDEIQNRYDTYYNDYDDGPSRK